MSNFSLKEIKLSRNTITIAGVVFMVMLILSAWEINYNRQLLPVDPKDKTMLEIKIPHNSSAMQIASVLKSHQLIRNTSIFLAYCNRTGLDSQLKAGVYRFSRSQSLPLIAEAIASGRVANIIITIPEGYTEGQIGELLIKRHICNLAQWQAAIQKNYNYDFLRRAPSGSHHLEGFLFPDTYSLQPGVTVEQVLNMMLKNFAVVWKSDFAGQAEQKNMNVYQTVVVASMIEREAKLDSERETIAGVIYNRLRQNIPLQIDSTVTYALGGHLDVVTYKDLQVNSPYNTYKNTGLPPGPISCPGRASIEAALNPQRTSYYYYVARGDGSHVFSRTYAEHLQAKQKYIK